MDYRPRTNLKSTTDMFFHQLTELGSLVIMMIIIIILYFFEKTLAIKLFIGIILITIIATIIKALFYRPRPKKQKYKTLVERLDASSFPSIHSARITFVTMWIALVIANPILKVILIITGLLVAYSRIYLKKHHLSDVIAGIILGIIVCLGLYYIIL